MIMVPIIMALMKPHSILCILLAACCVCSTIMLPRFDVNKKRMASRPPRGLSKQMKDSAVYILIYGMYQRSCDEGLLLKISVW